jgi:hypothetical protein
MWKRFDRPPGGIEHRVMTGRGTILVARLAIDLARCSSAMCPR